MFIVALDTTTSYLSIAVSKERNLIASVELRSFKRTSSELFVWLDILLSRTGIKRQDIDVIALTVGPGSFTGVRIGVAAVKGFAYAHSKAKIVTVSTLEALAYSYPAEESLIFSIVDAKRGQFYGALFRKYLGVFERLTEDSLFSPDEVLKISERAPLVGYPGRLDVACHRISCLASCIAEYAYHKALRGEFTDLKNLKPIYLRPSDAEESKGIRVT